MTQFEHKRFHVSMHTKSPIDCAHTWLAKDKDICVLCKERFTPEVAALLRERNANIANGKES